MEQHVVISFFFLDQVLFLCQFIWGHARSKYLLNIYRIYLFHP